MSVGEPAGEPHVRVVTPLRTLAVAAMLSLGMVTSTAAGRISPAPGLAGMAAQAEPAAPRADAPEAFTRSCGRCHTADRIVEGRRSRIQWEEVVEQMVARGATVGDDDYGIVIEYLVSEFGRVVINRAPADEVAQVLHLDAKDATAIVDYRKSHGPFADFDALVAMPAAPAEALRKRRDAIVF